MARSCDEASATRRARLPIEAWRDGAVFEQTYRLALQVMERRELRGLTGRARREDRHRPGRHQQDRAWLDLPEREDAPSPRRRPRSKGRMVDKATA
jgi:hypothetical protein